MDYLVANGEHFQNIVIGSGPGGSVTAAFLAEAGHEVLILEQGQDRALESVVPFGPLEMAAKYRNGGLTVAFGNPRVSYVEGQCLGGGSEVNSGLYFAPPGNRLAHWADVFGVKDTSGIQSAAMQVEKDLQIQFLPGSASAASLKLANGALSLGWAVQEVPRWYTYDQKGIPHKQSMSQTYLPRAREAGAQVRSGVRVVGLRKNSKGWEVLLRVPDEPDLRLLSAEYVFLCAGAIQSAALIRRSGLSRIAGRSLFMHPSIKVTALFDEDVNSIKSCVPVHQVKEFAPQISLGGSISQPHHLRLALMDNPQGDSIVSAHWRSMATYYAMTAEGNGSVTPVPFFDDPFVKYQVGEMGQARLRDGLEHLCECLFAAGARTLFPSVTGAPPIRNLDEARRLSRTIPVRDMRLMTIHLMGSCPMGEDSSNSAVDSFGRVHGQAGLYVNDASTLPSALGVNPQGTLESQHIYMMQSKVWLL